MLRVDAAGAGTGEDALKARAAHGNGGSTPEPAGADGPKGPRASPAAQAAFSVSFVLDGPGKRVVARVIDKETGEILRQVPPEGLLELAEKIGATTGLVLDQEV